MSVPTGERPTEGEWVAKLWHPQDLSAALTSTFWALSSFVGHCGLPPALSSPNAPSPPLSMKLPLSLAHPLAVQRENDLKN